MSIVYRHIRHDKNEPFYVGIGKTIKRAYHTGNRRTKHWNGIANITTYHVEILFEDISWEDAQKKEIELIKLYGRRNIGTGTLVNLTDGGQGVLNRVLSAEGRRKISEAQKRIGADLEERKRRSERMKGENNHRFGKPSPRRGAKVSVESIAKRVATTKKNGKPVWNKGIPRTEEQKRYHSLKISGRVYSNISEENKRSIIVLMNNNLSFRKISKTTGVTRDVIRRFITKGV